MLGAILSPPPPPCLAPGRGPRPPRPDISGLPRQAVRRTQDKAFASQGASSSAAASLSFPPGLKGRAAGLHCVERPAISPQRVFIFASPPSKKPPQLSCFVSSRSLSSCGFPPFRLRPSPSQPLGHVLLTSMCNGAFAFRPQRRAAGRDVFFYTRAFTPPPAAAAARPPAPPPRPAAARGPRS